MTLRSTTLNISIMGILRNIPGPFVPISRPNLKITALSYSLTTFIEAANNIKETMITKPIREK
jgi:hypothetical protein